MPALQTDSAVLVDPQTSSGLLIAIAPENLNGFLSRLDTASIIGEITTTPPGTVQVAGAWAIPN